MLEKKWTFSSPEAALLLVSTKNRDLWPDPTPEVRDSRISRHCACSGSSLANLIGSSLILLCLQSQSELEPHLTYPEVVILGADQKERDLWGREWELKENNVKIPSSEWSNYYILYIEFYI